MKGRSHNVEVLWRVWVVPDAHGWKLASGPEMKNNRRARKVTLDAGRFGRLLQHGLPADEPLEFERESLEVAA